MAPNLDTIKDISARISCFRRTHKEKDSIDGDKPSETPNQSTTKRSAHPAHPAQAKSHGSHHRPLALFLKKENNDSLPPLQLSTPPENVPTPLSKPPSTLLSSHPVAQLPAAVISYPTMSLKHPPVVKKSANSPGSDGLNPINTPGKKLSHKAQSSMASSSHLKASQGTGTSAKKQQESISWFPPYQNGPSYLHTQPAPPFTYNNNPNQSWKSTAYLKNHFLMPHVPKPQPPVESLAAQTNPLHSAAWSGLSAAPPGSSVGQEMLDKSVLDQHAALLWPQIVPELDTHSPFAQLHHKPDDDDVEIDATHVEDNDEPTDMEQHPENAATVEAVMIELGPLLTFVRACLGQACAGCHKKKSMESEDIINMTTSWANAKGRVNLGLRCQEKYCKVVTCLGCGKALKSSNKIGTSFVLKVSGVEFAVQWCCDDGKLAAIWALACGWEVLSSKSRAGSMINKVRGRVKSKGSAMRDEIRGTRIQATAKGIGYGGDEPVGFPNSYFGQRAYNAKRSMPKQLVGTKEDILHENYFRLLASLLPSRKGTSALDASPPNFLSHMLSRSPLLENAAMLLSNGSIDEMSCKNQLHDAVLDFFDALGGHPVTADLVYAGRNLYHANGGNLLEASLRAEKSKGRLVVRDTGKSLIELLGSVAAQSDVVLRHAKGNPSEFHNPEGRALLALSRRLSKTYTHHIANMQRIQTAMDIMEDKPNINFSEWHHENCVRDVPDDAVLRNFAFSREVCREASICPERGRMKRLITEISTLRTSLPEGIFICHGSSRLDIMKVLIIGPKHTPYEHGMFEFDLYCSVDYPKSPPKMVFKTPNGSRTRFNPNLYHDGKICLSLLGTWPGEPWRADQSTLLQVLVSIQSMIFCEEPWYNEPGRECNKDKEQSEHYNSQVRILTMQYAQLPWIKTLGANVEDQNKAAGPSTKSLWQETAELYLRANKKEILDLIKQALEGNKSPLKDAANSVSKALKNSGCLE
ncbi:hypothetical protein K445DRAFT_19195 [Daldinia sp. EC12]|nr:hypothetical protein K445DRAFT_19195 [Daldinia sp. EC12]